MKKIKLLKEKMDLSNVLQHEIDHLKVKLFVDYLSSLKAIYL